MALIGLSLDQEAEFDEKVLGSLWNVEEIDTSSLDWGDLHGHGGILESSGQQGERPSLSPPPTWRAGGSLLWTPGGLEWARGGLERGICCGADMGTETAKVRSNKIPRRAHPHIREPCSMEGLTAGPGRISQMCPVGETTFDHLPGGNDGK